jgi:hypothetical protein
MGSAAVVHLFVNLQGRPLDLDTEKEGATSPDRSSAHQKAVSSVVVVRLFVSLRDRTDLDAEKEGAT